MAEEFDKKEQEVSKLVEQGVKQQQQINNWKLSAVKKIEEKICTLGDKRFVASYLINL